jgi:hypothetical protein
LKSHESEQIEVLHCIYRDACSKCTADVSDLRDLMTIESRVNSEGLSFLTISLPNFCKDFERCLAAGHIEPSAFPGFRKTGAIPAFLRGMLVQLFDQETGRLFDVQSPCESDDSHVVVEAVRQICRAFTKLESPCTPKRVAKAIAGFVQTERDLSEFTVDNELHTKFSDTARFLWDICLSGFDPAECIPKHGPGTTAEGVSGNGKYSWQLWHERLEPYFPFLENAYSVSASLENEFNIVSFAPVGKELPVKVAPVPKTQKGPRIIAIEPCSMQYVQGSIQSWLYARVESARMSAGHVNFTDQSINRQLALDASASQEYATFDLSDASDRVPLSLVETMFKAACGESSLLWDSIMACRSDHATLPDGTILGPLKKFASMGSALCFPVEAMYFYTCVVECLLWVQGIPVTRESVYDVSRSVYVYGDDIIIPRTNAVAVLNRLALYNCKVNFNKSFWNGNFRESCGMDAYCGQEVTPTYIRKFMPQDRRQSDVFISLVETANHFYKRGYWRTADRLFEKIERHLGSLPYVGDDSSVLGRFTFLANSHTWTVFNSQSRWNDLYQRFEVKGWVEKPAYRTDELRDYAALQKCLLKLRSRAFTFDPQPSDPLHLERTARYGVATLKRRWAPA